MLAYIKSSFLEQIYVNQVLDFLRKHVFPYEELFARCYFLGVRALDAYSNTPHEGTNAGAKYCENRVVPSMSQAESTKTLNEQDEARTKVKRKRVADSYNKTQLNANAEASQRLQKEADSHLNMETEAAASYMSIRIGIRTWLVLCGVDREVGNSPIPAYERVRTVTIDEHGRMSCSCGYVDHYGIPDRHVAHVALAFGVEFMEFSHNDVALRHHDSYCKLVATKPKSELSAAELAIRSKLIKANDSGIAGPQLKFVQDFDSCTRFAVGSKCNSSKFDTYEAVRNHVMSVKEKKVVSINYSEADIQRALRALNEGGDHAAGFSQTQHNCEEWSDDDDDGGGSIAFNFDALTNAPSRTKSSAYEEGLPRTKDFLKAIEGVSSEARKTLLDELDRLTKKANEVRVAERKLAPPIGSVVSGKLPAKPTKQKKQSYYGGSS